MTEFATYPQLKWRKPESAALSAQEGTVNCAAAGGAGLANWGAEQDHLVTHHEFRLAAGNPGKVVDGTWVASGLSSAAVLTALKHFGCTAERFYAKSIDIAREALMAGYALGIAADYREIKILAPALSGQLTFKRGHFVDLFGFTFDNPDLSWWNSTVSHDTLYDGRTRGWGTAPLGPQVAPFWVYAEAMGKFRVGGKTYAEGTPIGTGKGIFIVVKPRGAI